MIKNITKKTVIAEKYEICDNLLSQSIGLMFSKQKTLLFIFNEEKIIPLHMMFVFYPIDVLFLDSKKRVVDIKESFKPFTFYTPKKKARYVVELSNGTVKKSRTQLKDTLSF